METKRENTIAKFSKPNEGAENVEHDRKTIARHLVIDKKTEKVVVDCHVYTDGSDGAINVTVGIKPINKPAEWGQQEFTFGHGSSFGTDCDESTAIDEALMSAGVELYGCPQFGQFSRFNYEAGRPYTGAEFDAMREREFGTRCSIAGWGRAAVTNALLAVAYAAGCEDAVIVKL